MAGTTTETRNYTYLTVKSVAYGMFGTGLALSVTHTYDLFHHTLGAATVTSAAVPVFIDGVQLIGRLARSPKCDAQTRRLGKWAQLTGATISLAANIIAGHAIGDKIAGAIFVLGYILMEAFAEKMRPVEQDAKTLAAQATAASGWVKSLTMSLNSRSSSWLSSSFSSKAVDIACITCSLVRRMLIALLRAWSMISAALRSAS